MDTLPVPIGGPQLPATAFDEALAAGADFAQASKSPATRRAYDADWRDFSAWCARAGRVPLPADALTAVAYFGELARRGLKCSTIDRRAASIAFYHRLADADPPTASEKVRVVLQGIRNTLGRKPAKKQALTVDLLVKVVRKIKPDALSGLRDRAILLLAFGSALRRSELVAIDVSDLMRHRRGLLIEIRRSKTDQQGRGHQVAIPNGKLKIAEAVEAWRAAAGITDGALFRGVDRGKVSPGPLSDKQFTRILKARCAAAGLDPDAFGGHSTRSGFATSADEAGADLSDIARQMRHAKLETTRGYIQEGELFRNHAGKGIL
jgi:integrase